MTRLTSIRWPWGCVALLASSCAYPDYEFVGEDLRTDAAFEGGSIEGGRDVGCPIPFESCGGGCVDVTRDPTSCGKCGQTCPAGTTCAGSACKCPAGLTLCGTSCVDLTGEFASCGSCGKTCGTGQVCANGTCATACPTGRTSCSGSCIDLATNPDHCGQCTKTCRLGDACVSGTCVCSSTGCAGGTCGSLTDNCGATVSCGSCDVDHDCASNHCVQGCGAVGERCCKILLLACDGDARCDVPTSTCVACLPKGTSCGSGSACCSFDCKGGVCQ